MYESAAGCEDQKVRTSSREINDFHAVFSSVVYNVQGLSAADAAALDVVAVAINMNMAPIFAHPQVQKLDIYSLFEVSTVGAGNIPCSMFANSIVSGKVTSRKLGHML